MLPFVSRRACGVPCWCSAPGQLLLGGAPLLSMPPDWRCVGGGALPQKMDPQMRKLLEVTHEAFVDSGIDHKALRGSPRVGVYLGCCGSEVRAFILGKPLPWSTACRSPWKTLPCPVTQDATDGLALRRPDPWKTLPCPVTQAATDGERR